MRQLRVELDRFGSRRAVALLVLAAALLTAALAAAELWNTRPVTAEDVAVAETRAAGEAASPGFQRELGICEENPEQYFGPGTTAEECAEIMTPRAEWFLDRQPLRLGDVLDGAGTGVVIVVTALLVIAGATFAGADWATASMGNQVLFEPRRGRVWLSKALAVLVGGLVVAAVLVAGFWLVMQAVADARGIVVPDGVRHDIVWYAVRGVLLAGAGALGGFALTMLVRSTVATLAVLFVYSVGGEALVLALPLEKATQWSLANNVFAWIQDGATVYDEDIACTPGLDFCDQTYVLGPVHGAVYLGVLLAVPVLVSLLLFRRRDVP